MNTFSFSKLVASISLAIALPLSAQAFEYKHLSTYTEDCGEEGESCAEISAYDKNSSRIFITNAEENQLRILSADRETGELSEVSAIDLTPYGGGPNSVAVNNGLVAVAVEANVKQDNGTVEIFDTNGTHLRTIAAGALPDMVTFTPNGRYIVVANEGEPNNDYTVDPEGSVTVINTHSWTTKTADFNAFDAAPVEGVRVYGPGASFSQDMEPEYITVSANSSFAWVSLQENNAMALMHVPTATILKIYPLGYKNHSVEPNAMDASNKDDAINITTWPTLGLYQPDAIASFEHKMRTFIVTANEGDSRDYDGYSEEKRIKDIELDPTAFPNAAQLQENENLGRLKVTTSMGDTDGDGDFDELYSYGARSFSIWSARGELVFDSGSIFERTIAKAQKDNPDLDIWKDDRSDDKGPEPESITVGRLGGKNIVFVGCERTSDIFVFDLSNPYQPELMGMIDVDNESGDISPEGLSFISKGKDKGWLLISNEISNTTSLYEVKL